jgi:hypothetical protein
LLAGWGCSSCGASKPTSALLLLLLLLLLATEAAAKDGVAVAVLPLYHDDAGEAAAGAAE